MKKAGLSREKVLDAALELADRAGIAGLSMRKLGAALGVEAMTLYYYVPNKDALLDGLVERVVTRAFVLDPNAEWRPMLSGLAAGLRRELLKHPALVHLVATRPVTTPQALRMVEDGVTVLRKAGFGLQESFHVLNGVTTFTTGHCLAEIDPPGTAAPAPPDLTPYPALAQAIQDGLGTPENHQARFTYALESLIGGFAARLQP